MQIRINQWVNDNNPDPKSVWGNVYWDYIEFMRYLETKFDLKAYVVDVYSVETPPPEEIVILPLVCLENMHFKVYLKEDFTHSGFADAWFISFCSINSYNFDHHNEFLVGNLINSIKSKSNIYNFTHKNNNYLYPSHSTVNSEKFSGTVDDNFDVFHFIKSMKFLYKI